MAKITKRLAVIASKIDRSKLYPVTEALSLVKECATAKFDESIDMAVQLGIDPKKSDQLVRGSVVLPAGTGKTVRVAVFAQGDKAEQARAAGADGRGSGVGQQQPRPDRPGPPALPARGCPANCRAAPSRQTARKVAPSGAAHGGASRTAPAIACRA